MYCDAQDIIFNSETNKVELVPEAAIDLSIVASEHERLEKEVIKLQLALDQKEKVIQDLASLVESKINRIDFLTDQIISQNSQIDDISEDQINVAADLRSRFSLKLEANTTPNEFANFNAGYRFTFKLNKVYLLNSGYIGNNSFSEIRVGLGYTIF